MTNISETKRRLTSFLDLEVYQQTYQASILVMTKVIPLLPREEQDDLRPQLRRSCKAIPRLIAEGYAKRHQQRGFQKYLDDAGGECNEMLVSVSHCRDIYGTRVDRKLCEELIDLYDKSARQLFNLAISWVSFKRRQLKTPTPYETPLETANTDSATNNKIPRHETDCVTDHRPPMDGNGHATPPITSTR